MIWTVAAVTLAVVLAQHLGLLEAVARVVLQIAQCPKCATFWCCTATLLLVGAHPVVAAALSILAAYVAIWAALPLLWLSKLYNRLWQKIKKK